MQDVDGVPVSEDVSGMDENFPEVMRRHRRRDETVAEIESMAGNLDKVTDGCN